MSHPFIHRLSSSSFCRLRRSSDTSARRLLHPLPPHPLRQISFRFSAAAPSLSASTHGLIRPRNSREAFNNHNSWIHLARAYHSGVRSFVTSSSSSETQRQADMSQEPAAAAASTVGTAATGVGVESSIEPARATRDTAPQHATSPSQPTAVQHGSGGGNPSDCMQLKDWLGLSVTIPADACDDQQRQQLISHLNNYVKQVLCYGRAWDVVFRALTLTSECCLVHLWACDFWIAKDDIGKARDALSSAQVVYDKYGTHLSFREQCYMDAYSLMMQNKLKLARDVLNELLDHYPTDLFAIKKVQLLSFVLGGRSEMLDVVSRLDVLDACDGLPYFHGMRAFALQENEEWEEAERCARRSLEIERHDPWTYHCMAHIFFGRGQIKGGLEWFERHSDEWSECMSFMYGHSWFHAALLALDLDEYERTSNIYDRYVWPYHDEGPTNEKEAQPFTPPENGEDKKSDRDIVKYELTAESDASSQSTSFGVPLSSLSFHRHDRFYVEDQNNALNLLWRMEMRWAGFGSVAHTFPKPLSMPTDESSTDHAEAESTLKKQPVTPSSTDASSTSTPFRLHHPSFDSRWRSVTNSLRLPSSQPLSLFGLLHVWALGRCGRTEEAKQLRDVIQTQVDEIEDETRKRTLQAVLVPLASALYEYHTDPVEGAALAFSLIHPVLFGDLPTTPSSSGLSSSSSALSLSAVAARHHREASVRLACLSASGEQLDVLNEFYMHLAAQTNNSQALLTIIEDKFQLRRSVQWYHRLKDIAHEQQRQTATSK